MSSILKPPKMPIQTPSATAPINVDSATDQKKKLKTPPGRSNALLGGLQNALKKRLAE